MTILYLQQGRLNITLKSLKTKKASAKKACGTDKITLKLVKLASRFLSAALAIAINNNLASFKFPDTAKVTTVVPIDKKKDEKYDISNFQPVNLFNRFSKVYEHIIKCTKVDSMCKSISPFISVYRKN